jgi:hypothetical protein
LVVNDVEQVVEFIAARIDNAQSVAREVIGIECSDKDTYHHTDGQQQGHETVALFVIHFRLLYRYFGISRFSYSPR